MKQKKVLILSILKIKRILDEENYTTGFTKERERIRYEAELAAYKTGADTTYNSQTRISQRKD
jgi:hypothetical protein